MGAIILLLIAAALTLGGCALTTHRDVGWDGLTGRSGLLLVMTEKEVMGFCRKLGAPLLISGPGCTFMPNDPAAFLRIFAEGMLEDGAGIDYLVACVGNKAICEHELGLAASKGAGYFNSWELK